MPHFITVAFRLDEPTVSDMRVASDMDSARFGQLTLATEYSPEHYITIYHVDTTEESAEWDPSEIFDYFKEEVFGPCEKLQVASISSVQGAKQEPEQEKLKEASIQEITEIMNRMTNQGQDPLEAITLAVEKYKSAHSL